MHHSNSTLSTRVYFPPPLSQDCFSHLPVSSSTHPVALSWKVQVCWVVLKLSSLWVCFSQTVPFYAPQKRDHLHLPINAVLNSQRGALCSVPSCVHSKQRQQDASLAPMSTGAWEHRRPSTSSSSDGWTVPVPMGSCSVAEFPETSRCTCYQTLIPGRRIMSRNNLRVFLLNLIGYIFITLSPFPLLSQNSLL